MKKIAFLLSLLSYQSYAVDVQPLWGKLPVSLTKQALQNQLQKINEKNGHIRYQQHYKGIPIWGYQLIEHSVGPIRYSGYWVSGVEKGLDSIHAKLSPQRIKNNLINQPIKGLTIKKIIYLTDKKAKLAYLIRYNILRDHKFTQTTKIIDANDGNLYKEFDYLHKVRLGQGPGGNLVRLPSRFGDFQYGEITAQKNTLGRFDVSIHEGFCALKNNNIEVVSLKNSAFDWDLFPIDVNKQKEFPVFSYPCSKKTQYINYDDEGYAPIHEGLSPVNDAMFFAQTTFDMYQQFYGDDQPLGNDLPVRIYTHIANLDNAFAMATEYENGRIVAHQQVALGNGEYDFAPMSQTTIPHELSHNVTANYADLIYEGQSGGINEAFSDMADLALRDYLSKLYPWYWDGKDWTIGREETLAGTPLRFMEKPSEDGYSIDTASDYYDGLDVHFSSGVFNRVFYLLAHEPGWNTQKAFQVMFDANRYYWIPNSNYDFAACGVIQAAKDRGWDIAKVIDAFNQVKVTCSLF